MPSEAVTYIDYQPRGAARALFSDRSPELLIVGPAGTGKSRASLEKVHLCAQKYAGMRALLCRKTLASLTASGLVTFARQVLHPSDGVTFFGGSRDKPPAYRYPNGSEILVGGLDKASKVMSTEYDMIYVQEATELTEADWEALTTRLRGGAMPYQQQLADCNPDAPRHWLKLRCDAGRTRPLESRHEDNPLLWDGHGWTERGRAYIALLDALSGARKLRLRYGIWAAAEGMVYEAWDDALNLIDSFPVPAAWRRLRVVDFGFTNAFVAQFWAIDPDGRMYLYREIYRTQRIVTEHARDILRLSAGEEFECTVADHDAEDRATLAAAGVDTLPAWKLVSPGIQAVQARIRPAGDGRPRLFIMRDALVERDEELVYRGKPYATVQEIPGYVWAKAINGRPVKEEPVKVDDHGMDAMRYAVCYVDDVAHQVGGVYGMSDHDVELPGDPAEIVPSVRRPIQHVDEETRAELERLQAEHEARVAAARARLVPPDLGAAVLDEAP